MHAKRLSTSTDLKYDDAEYVASYYIGTPPTQVKAFVDTGSDTIWTMVGVDPPLFNPSNSTAYQTLACKDESCQLLGPSKTCTEGNEPCSYKITYGYGDDGTTSGVFSRDKFSFDGIEDVGYLNFGCNNEESGFGKLSGCLALNRGELSFISQLGIKKFSHCWESNGSAIMYFGAKIYPNDLTPFLEGTIQPFYYIQVDGISIDEEQVPLPQGVFDVTQSEGGFIVDCGTSYTMLRKEAYEPFLSMMRRHVHKPEVKGPESYLELCYNIDEDLGSMPEVTFRFARGVKVKLTKEATFMEFVTVRCLVILRSPYTLSVFGNYQMQNYWVGYDLESKGISFTYQQQCLPIPRSTDIFSTAGASISPSLMVLIFIVFW